MAKKTYRIIKKDNEAREALKRGIDAVVDVVKMTLGPRGRNCIFEYKNKVPRVTNDGVSIAREIILKDEIEDLGAQTVIEAGQKTNQMVGDGTTSSMVLTQKIVEKAFEAFDTKSSLVGGGQDPMSIKREIDRNCEKVVEELKKSAKKITKLEDIENVAITSMEDEKIGKIIAEMVKRVGVNGFISVDDSYNYETETDIIEGMKFYGRYAADFMITNARRQAVFEDTDILVSNHNIETRHQIIPIADKVLKNKKKKFVIFARKFSPEVLASIYNTARYAHFDILAVKIPSLLDEQREDICCYTGANFIDKEKGMELENAKLSDLGRAAKVIVTEEETIILGGGGNKKDIKERIKTLKENIKVEEDEMFRKKIERRIASLTGGVGVIKVGGKSDTEKYYLKAKIEDAVHATKAALEEGVVKGGGLALKEIAEKLDENILTEALKSCYEQIQENAGGELKIGNVLDPVKVVRVALENACSVAGTLITTSSAMAWKRFYFDEEIKRLLDE